VSRESASQLCATIPSESCTAQPERGNQALLFVLVNRYFELGEHSSKNRPVEKVAQRVVCGSRIKSLAECDGAGFEEELHVNEGVILEAHDRFSS